MNDDSLKNKLFSGVMWKGLERICAQGVSTIVSIILARILAPEDYAVISIVSIFFMFCNVFISSGFNTALVQKKDADELDYSTVFSVSFLVSVICYFVMFFLAPYIAKWYSNDLLIPVIRVMSLTLIIDAVKSIVCAKISSNLDFKSFFLATIIGTVISAFVGIGMAYRGYGAWALVAQQMTNSFIDTVILFAVTKIRLRFGFSKERFKPLFKFSWKLFVGGIVDTVYNQCRPLIVGLKFSGTDLALYNKGEHYPGLINSIISDTICAVLFPAMTKVQDDEEKLLKMTRQFIRVSSYCIFPCLLGFFAVSDNFVTIVLTEKWLGCSIYLKIFCIVHMMDIIQSGNIQPISALGRTDVLLITNIIKKTVYFIIIAIFVFFSNSPVYLAISTIATNIFATIVNTAMTRKFVKYKLKDQFWDLFENLIPAGLMCAAVMLIPLLNLNIYLETALQVFTGIAVYLVLSVLLRNESLKLLVNFMKEKAKK